jgi:hypothetical protein
MKKPHPIIDVLHQNKLFQNLSQHSHRLNQINLALQQALPADFISRCHIANLRDNTLILHTDSASVANLLRFQSAELCQQISQQYELNISQLQIKVRPDHPQSATTLAMRQASPLSTDNAALISATADSITDPALKNALAKLATRVKSS